MKKSLLSILLWAGLFFWTRSAAAQNCSLTSVRCVGSGQEYSTIQSAADAAVAGDVVYVYNGTYAGFRVVSGHVSGTALAPITFQAQSSAVQITTPNSDGNGVTVNLVDYVTINGFTITGMSNFGIDVVECQSCQILNNTVSGSGQSNILTGFAYGVLIQGNTTFGAQNTQHGIYVSNSARSLDVPVVRGNTSYSNAGAGIQFNGDCNTYDHLGNSDGMISGALVENNVIHDNAAAGLSLINLSDSILRNNVLWDTEAVAGFKLSDEGCGLGTNRNLIVNNTIVAAGALSTTGVRIIQPASGNVIFNNIVINTGGNACVLDDTASACSNGGENNYYLGGLLKTPAQATTVFTNFAGQNFTLVSGSPAIGAGLAIGNSYLPPAIDILGNIRPYGGHWDDGAYQYNATAAAPDTTPPTTPGTPTSSGLTPYQVTLTWTASTDTREVLQYYISRDGTVIGFADGGILSYTDSAISPGSHTYTIAAVNGGSLVSTASGGLVLTGPGISGCLNADATWRNRALPTESGTFQWEADVTPFVTTANDGVVGLGQSVPNGYASMGVAVRFSSSGDIDVRNGGAYAAAMTLPFSVGSSYHLRVPINVPAHTLSVYVTPPGGPEQTLASNYAWRTEQASATSLGYVGLMDDQGSMAVCNQLIGGLPLDSMIFATLTPSTSSTPILVDVSGAGHPVMDRSTVVNHAETSYTLTEGGGGNRLLRFTSSSPVTVTVPAGLTPNQSFTLLQAGSGVIQIGAGAGVNLIQRRGTLRTAGLGAPVTIQSTGVQDEYVVWGDLQ